MKVTLESKFDIGDQVYIYNSYYGTVTRTTITDVRFSNGRFLYTTDKFPRTSLEEYELEYIQ